MDAKIKAQELVEKFRPYMYCFVGSGMLTNDYNLKVATDYAKQCAIIAVEEIIAAIKEFHTGAEWQLKESMAWTYWHLVIEEINKI